MQQAHLLQETVQRIACQPEHRVARNSRTSTWLLCSNILCHSDNFSALHGAVACSHSTRQRAHIMGGCGCLATCTG